MPWAVLLIGILSAGVWPSMPLFCALLVAFPYRGLWASVRPRALLRGAPWIGAALALVAVAEWLPRRLANAPAVVATERLVNEIFWSSANQPATFWVAHMLYYGPLLAFLPFVWNRLAREVTRHGSGLVVPLLAVVALARRWSRHAPDDWRPSRRLS